MPSFIYMHGLMTTLTCAEEPDVVTNVIAEAESEGEEWISIHALGSTKKFTPRARTPQGQLIVTSATQDSYTTLKIRHAPILAVREAHPGEIPDPSPDPADES